MLFPFLKWVNVRYLIHLLFDSSEFSGEAVIVVSRCQNFELAFAEKGIRRLTFLTVSGIRTYFFATIAIVWGTFIPKPVKWTLVSVGDLFKFAFWQVFVGTIQLIDFLF